RGRARRLVISNGVGQQPRPVVDLRSGPAPRSGWLPRPDPSPLPQRLLPIPADARHGLPAGFVAGTAGGGRGLSPQLVEHAGRPARQPDPDWIQPPAEPSPAEILALQ